MNQVSEPEWRTLCQDRLSEVLGRGMARKTVRRGGRSYGQPEGQDEVNPGKMGRDVKLGGLRGVVHQWMPIRTKIAIRN